MPGVVGARGMITAGRWRGSAGDSALVRPGAICRRPSARIRACGSATGCGPLTGRMRRCSRRCAPMPGSMPRTWSRFFRSTPPVCGLTSMRQGPGVTRSLPARPRTQGADSNHTKSATRVPGEPHDHALGRSRGGLTTKVHALADLSCTPVLALLSAGQAGDTPMLAPLVEALTEIEEGPDVHLLADKAYSHPSTRAYLEGKQISHTIPERRDQIAHREAKAAPPPAFDAGAYKLRNTV